MFTPRNNSRRFNPLHAAIALIAALANTSACCYDTRDNVLSMTDVLNRVTHYGNNNVMLSQSVTRTKPGGGTETLTTTHEYDAQYRPTKSILPDGTFTSMTYNSIGKQATMTDQLGRVTSHDYNELGYHVKTTYPDGLFDASTYDAEGRRQTSLDRAGRTMTYVYDKVGRTTHVIYPDTTSSTTTYDLSGQVTQSTDARGNVTKYVSWIGSNCTTNDRFKIGRLIKANFGYSFVLARSFNL